MKTIIISMFLLTSFSAFSSEICSVEESVDLTTKTIYVELKQENTLVNLPVTNSSCVSVMKNIIQNGEFSTKYEGLPLSIIYTIPLDVGSSESLKSQAIKKGLLVEVDLSNREILISKK